MLDLTNAAMFENLMSVNLDGEHVDLHNEYACIDIKHLEKEQQLNFLFRKTAGDTEVMLQFKQATIEAFKLDLSKSDTTLDLFYRGRFELQGKLYETSQIQKNYFYVSFAEGNEFEIFAKEVILIKQ